MKTSIIVLSHNNLSLTKACIQSVGEHTENYELILVDNGSTDGTVEYIQSLSNVKSILNEENVGYAKGCNQGITQATGEYILFLNNDTVVTKKWLINLINVFHQDPRIGMVGPVSNNVTGVQRVSAATSSSLEASETEQSNFIYSHRLVGFCLLVKRSVLEAIGMFDEQFELGSCEDDDLCYRVLERGYRLAVAKDVYIHHVGHASFTSSDADRAKIQNENTKKLTSKWQVNYFPYLDSRVRLDSLINILPDTALKILDVGCGIGTLGLELLNRNKQVQLWGIEENPLLSKLCLPYYEKILSEESLSILNEYFDLIIIQSSVEMDEKKVLNALQWRNGATKAMGVATEEDKGVYLFLSDITCDNALPIIKPGEHPKPDYLYTLGQLFSQEDYDLNTMLKKTIRPREDSILCLSRLISSIEDSGLDGGAVSEWTLESSDEFAQYKENFDQIFQYDLIIEVARRDSTQSIGGMEKPVEENSFV